MGPVEAIGLVLGVIGIVFAFEGPRRRFLRIFFGNKAAPVPSPPNDVDVRRRHADQLAAFLVEAQELRRRGPEQPIPVGKHNAWVERVSQYLRDHLGASYEVRFSDFSGMTFYGDGSERFQYAKSLDGRSRRLHEFITELAR